MCRHATVINGRCQGRASFDGYDLTRVSIVGRKKFCICMGSFFWGGWVFVFSRYFVLIVRMEIFCNCFFFVECFVMANSKLCNMTHESFSTLVIFCPYSWTLHTHIRMHLYLQFVQYKVSQFIYLFILLVKLKKKFFFFFQLIDVYN